MKLQGVWDNTVYASDGRDVLVCVDGSRFDRIGQLPLPYGPYNSFVYHILTSKSWRKVTDKIVGAVSTVNIWPISETDLLATVGHRLLASADRGSRWQETYRLPESSGPTGILPTAIAHHDGITYLGEYPLDTEATPRILTSEDHGYTWSVLTALPEVRHIHAVQPDPYSGDIWVTTGDTDSESQIGRLRGGTFETVGGGSQQWRAVELAFTPSTILWGMDCAYAGVNFIFKLRRGELGADEPTPEPVHRVPGSVYYSANLTVEDDRWVAFSTAMETGRDSTGPARQSQADNRGIVVAASSSSGYTDWHELSTYHRQRGVTDYLPGPFPRANGYVFLSAVPDWGLFVNPYNTVSGGRTIHRIPPNELAAIDRDCSDA